MQILQKQNHNKRFLPRMTALLLAVTLLLPGCRREGESPVPEKESNITTTQTEQPVGLRNPYTGLVLENAAAEGTRPQMFMINNAAPARPQWGLCEADIVLECMVEGGMTRMLWLFADSSTVKKIGPVRSARHDFVELAEGFDGLFIHWGRSPQALAAIKDRKVDHIDGISYSTQYFARDTGRTTAVEHRGYTKGEWIDKAVKELKLRTQIQDAYKTPFQFAERSRTPDGAKAQRINYQYSSEFRYRYDYQADSGLYYQSLNDKPFVADGGEQRAVTNVILLYAVVTEIAGDKKGRVDIQLTSGKGVYCTNGAQEEIIWKKGDPVDPLKLFAADGSELLLNAGKSYIGFVSVGQQSKTEIKE